MRCSTRFPAFIMVAFAASLCAALPVVAAEKEPAKDVLTKAQVDQTWASSWRDVSRFYIAAGTYFYAFPDYDKEYPSSVTIKEHRVTEKMYAAEPALAQLVQSYKDDNGIDRKRVLKKDKAEVEAAVNMLPRPRAGAYGWIRSGKVDRVDADGTVELHQVTMVDANALSNAKKEIRHKLLDQDVADYRSKVQANTSRHQHWQGHNLTAQYTAMQQDAYTWWFAERDKLATRQAGDPFANFTWKVVGAKPGKVANGSRWPAGDKGMQVAILTVDNRTVWAAPAALLDKGISEAQMLEMLKARGVSKADFAVMVRDEKRKTTQSKIWAQAVVRALEAAGEGK